MTNNLASTNSKLKTPIASFQAGIFSVAFVFQKTRQYLSHSDFRCLGEIFRPERLRGWQKCHLSCAKKNKYIYIYIKKYFKNWAYNNSFAVLLSPSSIVSFFNEVRVTLSLFHQNAKKTNQAMNRTSINCRIRI
jgi:hypothetical protein